jgi:hypothetical protein
MSQMRLNQLTGRWVTIVAERAQRPTDFAPRAKLEFDSDRPCPFCPGNEEATPPALETIDAGGSWTFRVVPNLYPAFKGDDGFAVHHEGPVHVRAEGTGLHEVFVYSPEHDLALDSLDDEAAGEFMLALKRRFIEHAAIPHIRYTQAIVNHGREAGASLVENGVRDGVGRKIAVMGLHSQLDAAAAQMIGQALRAEGAEVVNLPVRASLPRSLDTFTPDALVLVSLEPSGAPSTDLLVRQIRRRLPKVAIGLAQYSAAPEQAPASAGEADFLAANMEQLFSSVFEKPSVAAA